jgi:hypothetical protein
MELIKNEVFLFPDTLPTPPLPCKPDDNDLILIYGSNAMWASRFPRIVLIMGHEPMIILNKNERGELRIDLLRIFDNRGNIIARIDEDGFWIDLSSRKKRPNRSTLVVYDHNDSEVLRVHFLNRQTVSISGIFRKPGSNIILKITSDAVETIGSSFHAIKNCSGRLNTIADIVVDDNGHVQFN